MHRVLGAAAVAGAAALASAAPAAADTQLPLMGLLAPDQGSAHGSGSGDAPVTTISGNSSESVIGHTSAR
ncbi:hypothetical protein [Streptomyces sp. NPDC126499]|uniref:hypothetical protein n=1 Tax=Streptomyces sp. NPDC126499 TaxID=3155314 RepID=UPI00331D207B